MVERRNVDLRTTRRSEEHTDQILNLWSLVGINGLHDVQLNSERTIAQEQNILIDIFFLCRVRETDQSTKPRSERFQSSALP
jgi:hypothetical protein